MDVDERARVGRAENVGFQFRCAACASRRLAFSSTSRCKLHEKPPVELMRRQFVHRQSSPLRDGANRLKEMLVASRARLHMHHHVGRERCGRSSLPTASLAACACSRLAVRGTLMVTSTKYRWPARRTRTRSVFKTPSVSFTARVMSSPQAAGSHVQQRVQGSSSEPRAHPDNYARHAQRGHRIEPAQPGDPESQSDPRGRDSDDHDECAPHVGGKMQCVRFQRLARIFLGHAIQRA